jgi:hypothetical protein
VGDSSVLIADNRRLDYPALKAIRTTDTYLAEYHVGELTTDEIEAFLRDIGE